MTAQEAKNTWRFRPNPKSTASDLTPFQSWIVTARRRFVVAAAARRSGKTVGVRAKLLIKACETRNGLVGYVGPTLKQAKRLIWRALMRDLRDPVARRAVHKVNQSDLSIEFKTGTFLYLYGAERPEQIRGDGFDLLVCDEADDPNYSDRLFDEIIHPALSDQRGQLLQVGSPKGRGRLYREFRKGQRSSPVEERDPDYQSIQVTAIEAGLLDPAEIERARRTRPARAFAQEYEANFNAPIGIIYDEWDPRVHVIQHLPLRHELDDVIVGVDWGTSNRGTFLVFGIDRIRVAATDDDDEVELVRATALQEVSRAGVGYDDNGWWQFAREIQQRWHPSTWYCDPAGGREGMIRQLDNALAGSDRRPRVVPASNEVQSGIAGVQQLLHHNQDLGEPARLLIHEDCRWTQTEFGAYRWRPHRNGAEDEVTDEPLKERDTPQALDAARYALYSHLYRPHGRGRNDAHQDDRLS